MCVCVYILPPAMDKIELQNARFNLGMATGVGEGKL